MPTCPFCAKAVPDASSICPHCLRAQPAIPVATPRSSAGDAMHGRWRLALLVLVLIGIGGYAMRNYEYRGRGAEPLDDAPAVAQAPAAAPEIVQTTIAPPLDVAIADTASVAIDAGRYLAFPFSGGGRSGCRVKGIVQTLSGGDRRVRVFVVDRDGMAEVEAGRPPRTYYDSGPASAVSFDFNVDGRTAYTLVVSNPQTRGRAKSVRLRQVTASCTD